MAENVKTVMGLDRANVKTFMGIDIANVKTIMGVDNTGGGPSYLVNQNFETPVTGYDNGETWVEGGSGTKLPAYAVDPIVGTQSLQISMAGTGGYTSTEFTQQASVICAFRLRIDSFTGETALAAFSTPGPGSNRCTLFLQADGTIRIQLSTGPNNAATDVMPTGTDLWVWMEFTAGSGGDASARGAWSTTSTKPTIVASGGKTCEATGGGEISQAGNILLGSGDAETAVLVYDVILVQ